MAHSNVPLELVSDPLNADCPVAVTYRLVTLVTTADGGSTVVVPQANLCPEGKSRYPFESVPPNVTSPPPPELGSPAPPPQ